MRVGSGFGLRGRLTALRTRGAGRRSSASLAAVGLGALLSIGGLTGALALSTGVAAASTLNVCNSAPALVPGNTGSCVETFKSPFGNDPVSVTLGITSVSSSAGRPASSGVGSEAALDGTQTGLQVQVINTATGKLFLLGSVACHPSAGSRVSAAYPGAGYCTSSASGLLVGKELGSGTKSVAFKVRWLFPLVAGNPYQGSSATVTLQPTFVDLGTGSAAGGVLGAGTGPGGAGGVLGASTPSTGAQLPLTLSRLLVALGLVLLIAGAWVWRRQASAAPPAAAPQVPPAPPAEPGRS